MGSRFISAVALYGSTAGPVRDFLADVQALIAGRLQISTRRDSISRRDGPHSAQRDENGWEVTGSAADWPDGSDRGVMYYSPVFALAHVAGTSLPPSSVIRPPKRSSAG